MLIYSTRKPRVPEALAPCLTATGHSANGAESAPGFRSPALQRLASCSFTRHVNSARRKPLRLVLRKLEALSRLNG
jgi:hypothetical protein